MATKRCSKCGKNRQAKFYKTDRSRVCTTCQKKTRRASSRKRRLEKTYNLSHEQYEELLALQGGGCAICGTIPRYNLDVDHDHATGLVRGLLCKTCNRYLLPAARNQIFILLSAASYLQTHEQEPVLGGIVVAESE